MENFKKLKDLVENLENDVQKFYEKNNKAASVRLRKGLQEIKKVAQDIRIEVSQIRKQNEA